MQIVSTGPGDAATTVSSVIPSTVSIAVDQRMYKPEQGFISIVKVFMLVVVMS